MKITIRSNFNDRKWVHRLFRFLPCRHETVSVEENFDSRYGTHTSYIYCLNCGRSAGEIQNNCKHEIDCFGKCRLCLDRVEKNDCPHKEWCQEPDTDDYYCENCGEWKETQA